ncbi:hypothetical protein Gotri_009494 [Gossypium trilobum]|uniref:Protein ENHANCED DISEASE RESISTANCE 2 C-terminal domain-containing protein n=1 Tax=Gossypium trilobum TaxID=34281 RepID=A0A7J9ENF8_9ROSI|nr:hypothetical protein [Gossypium trilobum]
MCQTDQKDRGSAKEFADKYSITCSTADATSIPDWMADSINGGALQQVDLNNGTNGWSSPPEDPIPPGSLLYRFVNGDDAFRNQRLKMVNRIVEGPWIVKKAVGNYAACLIGKALTCNYHRGDNYLEIDVDVASSAVANAILHLALGCATSVVIDMGFVVEGQTEDELPEKLIGAVRVSKMEMSSATVVDALTPSVQTAAGRGIGVCKVNDHKSDDGESDDNDK